MAEETDWIKGIRGDFPVHRAVQDVMPSKTKILIAESYGTSAWTDTGKITVLSPERKLKRYFIKCVSGKGARALAEGEYHSVKAMTAAVPGLVPEPVGWGSYTADGETYHFHMVDFHDLVLSTAPDPRAFAAKVAEFHSNGTSPTGMFGFPVPTVIGIMQRTVDWDRSWARSFTKQLQDVIGYDRETNGSWPEFERALDRLIEVVIPRLLGALESEGRQITPTLVHGDLWANNVALDAKSGEITIFDPGCTYAHNEMEFGTWRCTWASHFASPEYIEMYQRHIPPSEPVDEWDDRNRLYCVVAYLVHSAGHPGAESRDLAYNDVLYLCEKFAPFDSPDRYNPDKDASLARRHKSFESSPRDEPARPRSAVQKCLPVDATARSREFFGHAGVTT